MSTEVMPWDAAEATNSEDRRAEWIAGARELIDLVEREPDLPLPSGSFGIHLFDDEGTAAAYARYARALGNAEKDAYGQYFMLVRRFRGGIEYRLQTDRQNVCERIVTTREVEVEEPDPEAVAALPLVKQTKVVEDVEWVCPPSLLAKGAV